MAVGAEEPLVTACAAGDVAGVLRLVAEGVDVNRATSAEGWTPLLWASHRGHAGAVRALVGPGGADVNAPGPTGATPLFVASERGHLDVVLALLDVPGVDVNQANSQGDTPLTSACGGDSEGVVRALLGTKGVDINRAAFDGLTPLHLVVQMGSKPGILHAMLEAPGIDVNRVDVKGRTPLFEACSAGKALAVEALISAGADAKARGAGGGTLLDVACMSLALPPEGRTAHGIRIVRQRAGPLLKVLVLAGLPSERAESIVMDDLGRGWQRTVAILLKAGVGNVKS